MFQDRGTVHVVRGARGFALAVRARSSLLSQAFWAVSQHHFAIRQKNRPPVLLSGRCKKMLPCCLRKINLNFFIHCYGYMNILWESALKYVYIIDNIFDI